MLTPRSRRSSLVAETARGDAIRRLSNDVAHERRRLRATSDRVELPSESGRARQPAPHPSPARRARAGRARRAAASPARTGAAPPRPSTSLRHDARAAAQPATGARNARAGSASAPATSREAGQQRAARRKVAPKRAGEDAVPRQGFECRGRRAQPARPAAGRRRARRLGRRARRRAREGRASTGERLLKDVLSRLPLPERGRGLARRSLRRVRGVASRVYSRHAELP